jgi:hypothetical protein
VATLQGNCRAVCALRFAPIRSASFRMLCRERAVELAGGDLQAVMADLADAAAGSDTRHLKSQTARRLSGHYWPDDTQGMMIMGYICPNCGEGLPEDTRADARRVPMRRTRKREG